MNGRRRGRSAARTAVGTAALALSVLLTGCGSGEGDEPKNEIASVDGEKAAANGKEKEKADSELSVYLDGVRKHVACMRQNGVEVSDPDAMGRVEYNNGASTKDLKSDPKFLKAGEKCSGLQPVVPDSVEREMNPKPTREETEKRKRYATCMQESGAPDFPDARDDGSYEDVPWDGTTAAAQRAMRKCQPILGPVPENVTPRG
ncbi:hypothetical protein AB0G74_10945 [Streptomyces sp. NPDC020875]|uniref:hypothetical protein n=1 Tax=Streptomyces sp. NPDC020875 TaxID=3154898 RepID=UPI0034050767